MALAAVMKAKQINPQVQLEDHIHGHIDDLGVFKTVRG